MLHLISRSPIAAAILERVAEGDDVVFLENAVVHLLQTGHLSTTLGQMLKTSRLYVLSDDIAVRGIAADTLLNGIAAISYAQLVGLAVSNPQIQSWF